MRVAVIGGGIIGMASGYYLARRGADVTVYEQGGIGNGSTERSAGGIRRQFSTPVNVKLSDRSIEVWDRFEEEFGEDIDYRRSGYLFLARSADVAEQFRETVAMQNDLGVPTELVDPERAADIVPELDAAKFRVGMYLDTDGFADPHLALQGFAQAVPAVGGAVETKTAVTDVLTTDGAVTGVEVEGERVETDFVVNAAGPWAHRVAEMAEVSVPVRPKRRQVLVVEPQRELPESVPLTIDLETGVYFRPEREGTALVGGHFDDEDDPDRDPDHYSQRPDMDWQIEALELATDVAGYFGPDARIRRGWAGLYAVTPDHHPILEETIPGLVSAIGFSGHGFQQAPATGQIVTELIFDGEPSLVDVSQLTSDRFETGDLIDERNVA
ncbi:Glycine/D-amino acid oxidase (deaminating) [Halanaeroarchaeum sp. HSR-CO]|uniref:NAD(P)/FAD-dependent oxidoreductase n=1 Tax=Halanaeroarchaeum sp. HSR-CO TaxID=2866382 RepID=UPI00217EBD87|nr:FAD-dependent oxidoreductase [Halanaeroarchaeum sp. HSR-CO]UWG46728.1 Glycine/D-amino acid oxidase (deaminating) [Halanaeroarchaeum sp. HSR-CO]